MTVLLALTIEQEEKLRQDALQRGLDSERLLHEVVDEALAQLEQPAPAQPARRIAGLHAGQAWISSDFDAPLPDSFWRGEDAPRMEKFHETL